MHHLDSEDPKAEEQGILRGGPFDDETRDHDVENPQYTAAKTGDETAKLGLRATAKLSFEFCLLWVWKA